MMLHHQSNSLDNEILMDSADNLGDSVLTSSISSEERNGSSDRSSVSPSNADDLMEDETHHQKDDENLKNRVTGLEAKIDYIQHQLTSIMRHLHAPACDCFKCGKMHRNEEKKPESTADASGMLSKLFPNASSQQLKTLLDLSKMNKLPSQVVKSSVDKSPTEMAPPVGPLGQLYSSGNGGGKIQGERMTERKLQRRVFPAPVSTYYQRKDSGNLTIPPSPLTTPRNSVTTPSGSIPTTPTIQFPLPTVSTTNNTSPGPSSTDGEDHIEAPNEVAAAVMGAQSGATLFTQSMVDMLKLNSQNAAHSSGSPGFLRGRGRGRPKLIGDELDADLVDYMVSLKNADPHGGHFTASQALHMARQYILERAPGLLEEHGGHVKLKLTWAMKLVSRIGERQKEMELGLPAGTLSNMGRNLTNLPGGNFMADVMAQNIFSQMMGNQRSGGNTSSGSGIKEEVNGNNGYHQNEENLNLAAKNEASTIPEIVNIKELNIPFLNNFLAELNEKNSGSAMIDGEIGNGTSLGFQA